MTAQGKTDHFIHFVKIELLVSLECTFDDELTGAFDAAIRRFIAKFVYVCYVNHINILVAC